MAGMVCLLNRKSKYRFRPYKIKNALVPAVTLCQLIGSNQGVTLAQTEEDFLGYTNITVHRITASGGGRVSGSHLLSFQGVICAGVAFFQTVRSYTAGAGGVVLAGNVANVSVVIAPQGGAVLNSAAPQIFIDYVNGTGGAADGGTATFYTIGDRVASGGSVTAGATEFGTIRNYSTSGGAVMAGVATELWYIQTFGGSVAGGTGPWSLEPAHSGGSVSNGTAVVLQHYPMQGGIAGGGTASFSLVTTVTPSGGAGGAGVANHVLAFNVTASGGILAASSATVLVFVPGNGGSGNAGSAEVTAIYNPAITGGSLGGGIATESFIDN